MLTAPDFKEKQLVLIFSDEGQKLSFQNDNLLVKNAEAAIILQLTCYRIFAVWLVGHTTITTGILDRSKKFGFTISHFGYGFRPLGQWSAGTEGNFLLRQKQYSNHALDIAQLLVWNKVQNQLAALQSIRKKNPIQQDAILLLQDQLDSLPVEEPNLTQLLGKEGSASRIFFSAWYADYPWIGRKPRAKIDPINVLMDIGYMQLFHFMEGLLSLYGFDLYKGVYHQNFYQRKSLVCDLVEPFRVIVDFQIRKAWNLRQIQEKDFVCKNGRWSLKYEKSKHYSALLLQGILEHKTSMFKYVQQYYRSFMRDKTIAEYPVYAWCPNPSST
jgi:CRISPR-associated protein Cas1